MKRYRNIILTGLLVLAFLKPLVSEPATTRVAPRGAIPYIKKFIVFITYPWEGFERHEVGKIEDMFKMKYSCDNSKHKVYLLKPGKYLRRKSNNLLYYIASSVKRAGKNMMIIKLVPYYGSDTRKLHIR